MAKDPLNMSFKEREDYNYQRLREAQKEQEKNKESAKSDSSDSSDSASGVTARGSGGRGGKSGIITIEGGTAEEQQAAAQAIINSPNYGQLASGGRISGSVYSSAVADVRREQEQHFMRSTVGSNDKEATSTIFFSSAREENKFEELSRPRPVAQSATGLTIYSYGGRTYERLPYSPVGGGMPLRELTGVALIGQYDTPVSLETNPMQLQPSRRIRDAKYTNPTFFASTALVDVTGKVNEQAIAAEPVTTRLLKAPVTVPIMAGYNVAEFGVSAGKGALQFGTGFDLVELGRASVGDAAKFIRMSDKNADSRKTGYDYIIRQGEQAKSRAQAIFQQNALTPDTANFAILSGSLATGSIAPRLLGGIGTTYAGYEFAKNPSEKTAANVLLGIVSQPVRPYYGKFRLQSGKKVNYVKTVDTFGDPSLVPRTFELPSATIIKRTGNKGVSDLFVFDDTGAFTRSVNVKGKTKFIEVGMPTTKGFSVEATEFLPFGKRITTSYNLPRKNAFYETMIGSAESGSFAAQISPSQLRQGVFESGGGLFRFDKDLFRGVVHRSIDLQQEVLPARVRGKETQFDFGGNIFSRREVPSSSSQRMLRIGGDNVKYPVAVLISQNKIFPNELMLRSSRLYAPGVRSIMTEKTSVSFNLVERGFLPREPIQIRGRRRQGFGRITGKKAQSSVADLLQVNKRNNLIPDITEITSLKSTSKQFSFRLPKNAVRSRFSLVPALSTEKNLEKNLFSRKPINARDMPFVYVPRFGTKSATKLSIDVDHRTDTRLFTRGIGAYDVPNPVPRGGDDFIDDVPDIPFVGFTWPIGSSGGGRKTRRSRKQRFGYTASVAAAFMPTPKNFERDLRKMTIASGVPTRF